MNNHFTKPLAWGGMLFLCSLLLSMPAIAIFLKGSCLPVIAYTAISVCACYLLVAVLYMVRMRSLRFLLGGLVFSSLIVMAAIDCFSINTYGEELNKEYVALIFETNIKEATEFMCRYLTFSYVAILLISILLGGVIIVFGWRMCVRLNSKIGNWVTTHSRLVSAIMLVCCVIGVANMSYAEKYPLKRACYFFNHKSYPELADYYVHPQIVPTTDSHPSKVILIIGESLTRTHCSLYGYRVETNPRLREMKESGRLYTFDNVTSLGTKTVRSLKSILSTYREEGTNWWEHLSVVEMLKGCGYTTYWKSNQEREGIYGVLATQYSKICDMAEFTCDIPGSKGMDEELLLMDADSAVSRKAVIYHLGGSHPVFESRYPEGFKGFTPEEYPDVPEHQRHDYATYDTSVLYNDSIVSEIMTRYADDDAVVVYFPDHGLDFYNTSDSYCGHSKNFKESLDAGRQIPFMIYVTEKYQSAHPDIIEAMKRNEHKKWCVSEALYSLMRLAGYGIEGDNDVEKYSLI